MLLSKSMSFSVRIFYSPSFTQINLFFKLINLAIDFFFRVGLPSYESPAKTICLSYKSLIVSNILPRSTRVASSSVSVLGL